jgi:hypothetical protein
VDEQIEYFYILSVEWNDLGALRRATYTETFYDVQDATMGNLYYRSVEDAEQRAERDVYGGKPTPRMSDATVLFWTCVPNDRPRPPSTGTQFV